MDGSPAPPKRLKSSAQDEETPPPVYAFCLLNEELFDHMLSFLGNQTLVKLQSITGDRYPNSRPELAKLCCPCENDNLAILAGLCTPCEKEKSPLFKQHMTLSDARALYGINNWGIPYYREDEFEVDRDDADDHMLKRCGSKMQWLELIAKLDIPRRKLVAKRIQNRAEYEAVLRSLPLKCRRYTHRPDHELNVAVLKERGERYSVLTEALQARGLQLRDDSQLSRLYIMGLSTTWWIRWKKWGFSTTTRTT